MLKKPKNSTAENEPMYLIPEKQHHQTFWSKHRKHESNISSFTTNLRNAAIQESTGLLMTFYMGGTKNFAPQISI